MTELPLGLPAHDPPAQATSGELDLSAWLRDDSVRARYYARVYDEPGPRACWPWLGAISSSGHGELQLGGRGGPVAKAHRLGFQIAYGPLAPTPPARFALVVMHTCDEHSCQNPAHWQWATSGDNTRDYYQRGKLGVASPLNDPRGRQARAMAIRDAVKAAGPWPDEQPSATALRPGEAYPEEYVDAFDQWKHRKAARLAAYREAIALPIWQEEAGQLRLF
ncbi:MAG: hypothetical protein HOV96_19400 [Nonomuraea sp.]|nr:hypothetical protein [Nonomuraea sp.]NUR59333.1 hypothetical protein [Catenulispora sp.]